ncbi:putative Ig domain-containing protein [Methanolobus sp. WCC4]|uniref:putative Ig domain-containing protein n=1 Tax=Methanolobus sp. WCC4 TaxID=3125784 RepID=UPI0030F660E7
MHPLVKNSEQNGILNYIRILLSISIVLSTFNPLIIASAAPNEPIEVVNTTGNFWVLHDWEPANTGNITDGYNISYNGTWANITEPSESKFNHSIGLGPHNWSNITIYAYNATSSTLSQGVDSNVQIPNNPMNITDINSSVSVTVGDIVPVDANFTDADYTDVATFDCNRTDLFTDFNHTNGTGSWIPATAGTYYVEFNVTDGYGLPNSTTMEVVVTDVNRAPVLSAIGDKSAIEGQSLNFSIFGNDPDGTTVTYSAESLPSGASLDETTGYFEWTPDFDSETSYNVNFIATSNGLEDNETITITVTDVDQAPVLSAIGDKSAIEGQSLNFSIFGNDPDGTTVTYSAESLPSGASLDETTGYFEWTPDFDSETSYNVNFIATSNGLEDNETITITVTDVDQAPVLSAIGDKSAIEGQSLNFSIFGNDPDGTTVTYSAESLPSGASLDETTGYFEWTPDFDSETSYNVNFIATSNGLEDNETITITVTDVDQAPVLSAIGDKSAIEGQSLNFSIFGNDPDGTTVTYSAESLPSGASLDETTGYFEWTPDFDSETSYNVNFIATSNGLEDNETITITVTDVDQAPVLSAIGDKSAIEGQSLNFSIFGNDPDGTTVTYSAESLPSGASLDETTGYFEWTPDFDSETSYNVNFIATSNGLEDNETITITVTDVDQAPVLSAIGDKSAIEGQSLNFSIFGNDPDGTTVTYSAESLPSGASLDETTGYFEWTPDFDSETSYNVNFIATSNGLEDNETITITVTDVDQAPVLSAIGDKSAIEGQSLNFSIFGNDPDGTTVTYSAESLPSGASLDETTGYFEWTPDFDSETSYNVNFIATSNGLEDNETITITVTDVDQAPVLSAIGDKSAIEGQSLNFSIFGNDPDGTTVTYSAESLPSGASLDETTGYFEWTPDFDSETSYNVNFIATSNGLEDNETITITVTDVDQAPVLSAIGDKSAIEGQSLNFSIFGNDPDGTTVTYSAESLPSGASLDETTGYFEWTPDFDSETSYNVNFIATSNGLEDNETITITVTDVDQAPVLSAIGDKSAIEGQSLNFSIFGNDPDGTTVTYSAESLPSGASLDETTGYFEWTPDFDSETSYNVNFIATSNGLEDNETITITVTDVDQAPVLSAIGDKSAIEGQSLNFSIFGNDPDGTTVTYSAESLPSGASLDETTGYFEWTPDFDSETSYNVNFIATSNGLEDNETITITVTDVDQAPVLSAIGDKSAIEGQSLNFSIFGNDPDGTTVTYSAESLPSGASLDETTGYFEWTPDFDSETSYNVNFIATSNGLEDNETITITVTDVDQAPVLSAIGDKSAIEGQSLNFSIFGNDPDGTTVTYSAESLPSGASLDETTGYFEWTPDFDSETSYNVNFIATSNGLEDNETITITVTDVDQAPVLSAIGDKSAIEGQSLNFSIFGNDPDGTTVTYSAESLPSGASLDETTGYFEWTPDFDSETSYNVNFIATSNGLEDNETITITVTDVDQAPVLSAIGDKSAIEGQSLNFSIFGNDPDGTTVTYSAESLPSGASLDETTGYFEWTPDFDSETSYNVNFIATSNGLEDNETITITVTDVDQAPVLSAIGDKSAIEGQSLNFSIFGNDPDGTTVTYSAESLPSGASLDETTGYFEWTPDFDSETSYNVNFIATSNGLEDNETITITVTDVDQAPVLSAIGDKSAIEGQSLNFSIFGNDPDGTTVTYSAESLPSGASLDETTGYFEWTPDFDSETSYNVNFIATSNGLEDNETITITVTDVDQAPVLSAIGDKSAIEGQSLNFSIFGNDPDGTTVTYSAESLPSGASLDETTGYFEWTPDFDSETSYNVNFIATSNGLEDNETITITVINTNQVPVFRALDDQIISEGDTLSFTVNATDADGNPVVYDFVSLPSEALFNTSTGIFSWTPEYDMSGSYTANFSASDADTTVYQEVGITVYNTNRKPVLDYIPSVSVNETEPFTIVLSATDPDDPDGNYPLYYSTNSSLGNLSDNVFTWTPNYSHQGIHHLYFTVDDGDLNDTKMAVIGVNNTNVAPEFDNVGQQNVSEGGSISFEVTATDIDNDALSYIVSGDPSTSYITYSSTGLTFTWDPDYDDAGTYNVTFIVEDELKYSDVMVVPIVVTNVNRAPTFDSLQSSYTINESDKLEIALGANDLDKEDSIIFWVNNTGNASGNLIGDVYTWETDYHDNGTYSIEFVVSDGTVNTSNTTTVIVNDINAPPELVEIGSKEVEEGDTLSFTISATDEDEDDNDNLIYSTSTPLPGNATFSNESRVFSWTPVTGEAGEYDVTFYVSDGEDTVSEKVVITVTETSSTTSTTSSSSGGGGGGGGGALTSGEEFDNIDFKDYTLKSVARDVETTFSFYRENNSIVSLSFTSDLNGGQVKAVIEVLKDTSSQVKSDAPGDVYQNMNIYIDSNLGDDVIGDRVINFKVDKIWIEENNIDVSFITLCRYNSGKWDTLSTEATGEDEKYYYFTAVTPGFSSFAISSVVPSTVTKEVTAEEIVATPVDIEPLKSTEEDVPLESGANLPQKESSSFPYMMVIGLIGVMAIGVVGYRNRDYYEKVKLQIGNPDGKRYRRMKK